MLRLGAPARRVGPRLEQAANDLGIAHPGRVADERQIGRPGNEPAVVRSDRLDDRVEVPPQRRHDDHFLRIGILGEGAARPLAARQSREREILGRHGRVCAELGQGFRNIVATADDRVLVRRAQRDVAAPSLTARSVQVGAVLGEEA